MLCKYIKEVGNYLCVAGGESQVLTGTRTQGLPNFAKKFALKALYVNFDLFHHVNIKLKTYFDKLAFLLKKYIHQAFISNQVVTLTKIANFNARI